MTTSEYLLETAKENIEGKITIKEANARISNYYEERSDRHAIETGTKEADIVAGRITAFPIKRGCRTARYDSPCAI